MDFAKEIAGFPQIHVNFPRSLDEHACFYANI